eukprot:1108857-Amorphochlora_amoeboformis.AAC.1
MNFIPYLIQLTIHLIRNSTSSTEKSKILKSFVTRIVEEPKPTPVGGALVGTGEAASGKGEAVSGKEEDKEGGREGGDDAMDVSESMS